MTASRNPDPASGNLYLPDFCAARSVFAVVVIVQLVALVLTLARGDSDAFWTDLARTALFLLWVGLACAAVLCAARRVLARQPAARAAAIAVALLVATIAAVSELVFQVGQLLASRYGTTGGMFPERHGEFMLRTVAIGFIVSAAGLRYFYVTAEWKRSVELEARARIRALQARIRPHFLFNSMNTIAALTRSDPARAEEAVEDLADLFRANLSDSRNVIPLKEELEVARIYQRVEQLRLGERLRVEWQVAELPMRTLVPSLLVQPLLENAVYHGIEALPEGGTITVRGSCTDGIVELNVVNPIPEITPVRHGNRLALDNIRQRLDLVWPNRSSVTVVQEQGSYQVTLRFPRQETLE
ncbi:MAG TPA: sensor histidine kinase [Steroidobacteraceae bacterium]|nr:sensor histidine kinase [Steroidobacteraceae bacterium]